MAKAKPKPDQAAHRLIPPADGIVVRMYRIGHGDCFLLAFPGETDDRPGYVLIDCGYKPGSPGFLKSTPAEITKNLREATGGRLDVVVITHEHQDHLNAITMKNFEDFEIGQAWFAWTEDPTDPLANTLRKAYKDQLVGLAEASLKLTAAGSDRSKEIDEFLAFELGGDSDTTNPAMHLAAAKDPSQSANKKAMKLVKDRAKHVEYIKPHEKILKVPGVEDVRVYALGPPHDQKMLEDLDPQGDEEFHMAMGTRSRASYFAAAAVAAATPGGQNVSPFSGRFQIDLATATQDPDFGTFFLEHYGEKDSEPSYSCSVALQKMRDSSTGEIADLVADNASWRRIETDWLYSAEQLALAMNNDTNNASLVLAFELGKNGKVLLFAADAQRGNWISWAKGDFSVDGRKVTTKDLLGRTVLYKAGHHCSHNATLNGLFDNDYPNLGWMAQGSYALEFTAMITAVREWAETQKGWDHPRKEIKDALLEKASGRVLQTDTDLDEMSKPTGVTEAEWDAFLARVEGKDLYFDLIITR